MAAGASGATPELGVRVETDAGGMRPEGCVTVAADAVPRGLDDVTGPVDSSTAAAVLARATEVAAAVSSAQGADAPRREWVEVVRACQVLVNTVTAAQDAAVAQVARRESVWSDDGTLGELVHPLGRVTVDAADLVAPALGASHAQAQRRVEQAVRLADGHDPVEADSGCRSDPSGLHGLHRAMAEGVLDGYRAGVVAHELEGAPAQVAEAVVAALAGHLGDDSTDLRRRTRRLVARISPDLLRQRAQRARASTGLRRWASEPGVDTWFGTFPTEDAATAWAAIDRLAHDYVADATCTSVEQARGKALTDLVTGNARVEVRVVVTVPADACPADAARETGGLGETATPADPAAEAGAGAGTGVGRGAGAGAKADAGVEVATPPDADVPAGGARVVPAGPEGGATATAPTPGRGDGGDDLVEVQGARPSEPMLVRRAWLRDHLDGASSRAGRDTQRARPLYAPCDPLTGARLDPGDELASEAYRPGPRLAALVRARDGRCRFPGCTVAARFCDLDHVRPWPTGPTAAANLLTVCRRHHRIKQSPGWLLRLHPDGTATWTDPTGASRTTDPLDALAALVLECEPTDESEGAASRPPGSPGAAGADRAGSADGVVAAAGPSVWSALETRLEFDLDHVPRLTHARVVMPPGHRRCTAAALRAAVAGRRLRAQFPDEPPF